MNKSLIIFTLLLFTSTQINASIAKRGFWLTCAGISGISTFLSCKTAITMTSHIKKTNNQIKLKNPENKNQTDNQVTQLFARRKIIEKPFYIKNQTEKPILWSSGLSTLVSGGTTMFCLKKAFGSL